VDEDLTSTPIKIEDPKNRTLGAMRKDRCGGLAKAMSIRTLGSPARRTGGVRRKVIGSAGDKVGRAVPGARFSSFTEMLSTRVEPWAKMAPPKSPTQEARQNA
jgi:hypothetical protein